MCGAAIEVPDIAWYSGLSFHFTVEAASLSFSARLVAKVEMIS